MATGQPRAARVIFTKGCKSKFTYFMRTIESFEDCNCCNYITPSANLLVHGSLGLRSEFKSKFKPQAKRRSFHDNFSWVSGYVHEKFNVGLS